MWTYNAKNVKLITVFFPEGFKTTKAISCSRNTCYVTVMWITMEIIKLKNSCIVIINEYKRTARKNEMKNVFSLATLAGRNEKDKKNCFKNE